MLFIFAHLSYYKLNLKKSDEKNMCTQSCKNVLIMELWWDLSRVKPNKKINNGIEGHLRKAHGQKTNK